METLAFISEMTKALAWPVASICIALIFRRQLQALLGRIKKGKVGPAEFEFEEGVKILLEAEKSVATSPMQAPSSLGALSLAGEPRAVVLESWVRVQAALEELARKKAVSPKLLKLGGTNLAEELALAGHLSPDDLPVYRSLRLLRNQATHGAEFVPSVKSVVEYARVAAELEVKIRARINVA